MKKMLAVCLAVVGTSALAQIVATPSTGTVTIQGTTAPAVSLKFDSADTSALTQTGSSGVNNGVGNQLDYVLNFGDVSDGNTGTLQTAYINLGLRSNVTYTVTGVVAGANPYVTPADIGFAITNINSTGVQVVNPRVDTIGGTFGQAPGANAVVNVATGDVAYTTTLNNIGGGATLLQGDRISQRGSFISPTNAILVQTEFTLLPQLFGYDPVVLANNQFSYVLTLTMTSP